MEILRKELRVVELKKLDIRKILKNIMKQNIITQGIMLLNLSIAQYKRVDQLLGDCLSFVNSAKKTKSRIKKLKKTQIMAESHESTASSEVAIPFAYESQSLDPFVQAELHGTVLDMSDGFTMVTQSLQVMDDFGFGDVNMDSEEIDLAGLDFSAGSSQEKLKDTFLDLHEEQFEGGLEGDFGFGGDDFDVGAIDATVESAPHVDSNGNDMVEENSEKIATPMRRMIQSPGIETSLEEMPSIQSVFSVGSTEVQEHEKAPSTGSTKKRFQGIIDENPFLDRSQFPSCPHYTVKIGREKSIDISSWAHFMIKIPELIDLTGLDFTSVSSQEDIDRENNSMNRHEEQFEGDLEGDFGFGGDDFDVGPIDAIGSAPQTIPVGSDMGLPNVGDEDSEKIATPMGSDLIDPSHSPIQKTPSILQSPELEGSQGDMPSIHSMPSIGMSMGDSNMSGSSNVSNFDSMNGAPSDGSESAISMSTISTSNLFQQEEEQELIAYAKERKTFKFDDLIQEMSVIREKSKAKREKIMKLRKSQMFFSLLAAYSEGLVDAEIKDGEIIVMHTGEEGKSQESLIK
ncbi:hypothetical protein ADUPG1_008780 [Aduncisulcus paluster]|uniref:Rad21/Rec8-like protein C-terminal eukaryotic domain-containing protein n=1 Tax=Aduncisulcus paluster TaxID=2918883 RepID=A0ABQ5KW51_9EUKA|nr:hypothetical protein ADUPG1_008780 [Aduncisulcus paluster]